MPTRKFRPPLLFHLLYRLAHAPNIHHVLLDSPHAVKSGELSGKLIPVKEQGDEKAHNHTELASDKANYEKLLNPKLWE